MRRLAPLLLLAGCASEKVRQDPEIHTMTEAALRHQIELDHQKVEQIAAQFRLLMWAMGIGGVVGLLGLALILGGWLFGLGKKAIQMGVAMVVFGVVVVSVTLAFPHYGEYIALGAAVMVGLVMVAALVIGFMAFRSYFITTKQVVEGVQEAKKELTPEAVAKLETSLSKAMDSRPKAIVRRLINKEKQA